MNEIPKYIHYCWFGNGEMPKSHKKNIAGWKKMFPGYEFILWNEENFPINDFPYAKQAYEARKYAFVSDVARMYGLNQYGGIYLDTDVEVIRNPEGLFAGRKAVLGWESGIANTMGTGFIVMSADCEIPKLMIDYYNHTDFVNSDGTLNNKSNTKILAELIEDKYNVWPSEEPQDLGWLAIYPRKYFTAFNTQTMRPQVTGDTYAIHHFDASWFTLDKKIKRKIKTFLKRLKLIKVENKL